MSLRVMLDAGAWITQGCKAEAASLDCIPNVSGKMEDANGVLKSLALMESSHHPDPSEDSQDMSNLIEERFDKPNATDCLASSSCHPAPGNNRRKRSRVVSMFRSEHSVTNSGLPADCQDSELSNRIFDSLITSKINPELRGIIMKYVSSESVIRCLELAEFTSAHVLACMDETQIRRLENFVGHACALIDQVAVRELFLGPIFSLFPEQFRLPSGAVCGLLLAVAEIQKRFREESASHQTKDNVSVVRPALSFTEAHSQTDLTFPINPRLLASDADVKCSSPNVNSLSPQPPLTATLDADSNTLLTAVASLQQQTAVTSDSSTPSSNTVALMAAAFQAAAVAAVTSGNNYSGQNMTLENPLFPSAGTGTAGEIADINRVSFPADTNSPAQNAARLLNAVPNNNLNSSFTSVPGFYEEETVDLDRLKHHSAANATRLASRQFLNAHLVRGRDFDMEMETTTTPEGIKRVTGIFYCHLCREKRERTSAVRFSIARNRYPVLSNVLSHLKTHFQYRGQLYPSSQPSNGGPRSSMSFMSELPSTMNLVIPTFSVPNNPGLGMNSLPYLDCQNPRSDSQTASSCFGPDRSESRIKNEPSDNDLCKPNSTTSRISNSFDDLTDGSGIQQTNGLSGCGNLPDRYGTQPVQSTAIS